MEIIWCEGLNFESFQNIFNHCVELREANFQDSILSTEKLDFLVNHISPKLEKLSIGGSIVENYHIELLIRRCNNLTNLDLFCTKMTKSVLISRSEHLKSILKNLDLRLIDPEKINNNPKDVVVMKSLPKLTVLGNGIFETVDKINMEDYVQDEMSLIISNVISPCIKITITTPWDQTNFDKMHNFKSRTLDRFRILCYQIHLTKWQTKNQVQ